MEAEDITAIYDARLVRIEEAGSLVTFTAAGLSYQTRLSHPAYWTLGTVGLLRASPNFSHCQFDAYTDQRLRRVPEHDQIKTQQWGWRIEDHHFIVRAGIVPGLSGAVIRDDCLPIEVRIPPEFFDRCTAWNVEPVRVLRTFIADLCRITDSRRCPREDSYCSSGVDERFLAREYFQRAHPGLRLIDGPPHIPADGSEPGGHD